MQMYISQMLNGDSGVSGIYRAKLIKHDSKIRVYVPCIHTMNPFNKDGTLKEKCKNNIQMFPVAQWCCYLANQIVEQIKNDKIYWVMFENGDFKRPVVISYDKENDSPLPSAAPDTVFESTLETISSETPPESTPPPSNDTPQTPPESTPPPSQTPGDYGYVHPIPGWKVNTGDDSDFGWRPVRKRNHYGVDMGTTGNPEVHAIADGIVTFAGENNGYGNCIIIQHTNGNGHYSLYGHLSVIDVSKLTVVKQNDIIGKTGDTDGNTNISTGEHLHLEIYTYDKNKIPEGITNLYHTTKECYFMDPEQLIPEISSAQ